MSIHSTEDFDPTSSTPIFGGSVSQTKIQQQQQPINDLGGSEKLITPPQPVVNGQNETTNSKTSDNLGNGTTESVNGNHPTTDSTAEHVNGQNGDTIPAATEPASSSSTTTATDLSGKSSQNEANNSVSAVTEPAVSTTSDTGKEELSSAPLTVADNAPPVPAISNETTSTSNEDVPASATAPEATVLAESSTKPDRQSKVNIHLSN